MAKQGMECGCGLSTCNVTATVEISVTRDGQAAVILATRDNNTADLVSIVLDARAIDTINSTWYDAVARRQAYANAVEPHAGK